MWENGKRFLFHMGWGRRAHRDSDYASLQDAPRSTNINCLSAPLLTFTHTHAYTSDQHIWKWTHTHTALHGAQEKNVTKTQILPQNTIKYTHQQIILNILSYSQQNNHQSLNSLWESVLNLPCNTSEHTYRFSGDKVSFVAPPAGINWAQVTSVRANALSMPCNTHYFDLQVSTGSVHMYAEYDSACKKSAEHTHCLTAPLRNICALNITKYACLLPSSLKLTNTFLLVLSSMCQDPCQHTHHSSLHANHKTRVWKLMHLDIHTQTQTIVHTVSVFTLKRQFLRCIAPPPRLHTHSWHVGSGLCPLQWPLKGFFFKEQTCLTCFTTQTHHKMI